MFISERRSNGIGWGDVRVFLAVMRKGSFGEAAHGLGINHPVMSRRIRAFKAEAQQALFHWTEEGLVLTDAGDRVLKLAETVENSALAIERHLTGNHERLEGILRISCAEWFANYVLAPALSELMRRHPAIVPEIIASYRLLNLSCRDANIAFRIVPFVEPDIVQCRLMTIPYVLYGTPDMVGIVQHDPAAVGFILVNTVQSRFSDVAWLLDRFPQSRRVFISTSRAIQAQMCQRGIEITVLPRPLGDTVTGLQPTSTPEPPPSKNIWAGYHSDLRHMDHLRVMLGIADVLLADPGAAVT